MTVDVVLGPLLTFVVFNPAKSWPHLRRDLAAIVLVQSAALGYGISTVYAVRPVAIVFEGDRFSVITADSILAEELHRAPREFQTLPFAGPWTLAVRPAEPGPERADALFTSLKGYDTSQRPGFWRPYAEQRLLAWAKAQPLVPLVARSGRSIDEFALELQEVGVKVSDARYLPVRARGDWVAVLGPSGNIATFLPLDGF